MSDIKNNKGNLLILKLIVRFKILFFVFYIKIMKILDFENEFFCKKVEYLKIRSLNFYIFYVYVLA